jgi:hypothetical protein
MDDITEHSKAILAAAHLAELRARARAIRDCRHLTPAAREHMRREVSAAIACASSRYRLLSDPERIAPPADRHPRRAQYRRGW